MCRVGGVEEWWTGIGRDLTHLEALVIVQVTGGKSLNCRSSSKDMEEDGWGRGYHG